MLITRLRREDTIVSSSGVAIIAATSTTGPRIGASRDINAAVLVAAVMQLCFQVVAMEQEPPQHVLLPCLLLCAWLL